MLQTRDAKRPARPPCACRRRGRGGLLTKEQAIAFDAASLEALLPTFDRNAD